MTQGKIARFAAPMAAMWLLMIVEQPVCAAAIARLPDGTSQLAAFGLAFALMLVIESPVEMLLVAGTALASNRQAYRRLLQFAHGTGFGLMGLQLAIGFSPAYGHLVREWIGAPEAMVEPGRVAFLILAPVTPMIAYRRLWQGVLIRHRRPGATASITAFRLATIAGILGLGLAWGRWPGAPLAAFACSAGVAVSALAAWAYARPFVAGLPDERAGDGLPWQPFLTFYAPLGATTLVECAIGPVLAFALSRSPMPLESLAVWPVVMALLMLVRCPGFLMQEAVVALVQDPQSRQEVRMFADRLAATLTAVLAAMAVPLPAALWYGRLSGLDQPLTHLAAASTAILAAVPGLTVWICRSRGELVRAGRSATIVTGVLLNLGAVAGAVVLAPGRILWPGAFLAGGITVLGLSVECAYLAWRNRPVVIGTGELGERTSEEVGADTAPSAGGSGKAHRPT